MKADLTASFARHALDDRCKLDELDAFILEEPLSIEGMFRCFPGDVCVLVLDGKHEYVFRIHCAEYPEKIVPRWTKKSVKSGSWSRTCSGSDVCQYCTRDPFI